MALANGCGCMMPGTSDSFWHHLLHLRGSMTAWPSLYSWCWCHCQAWMILCHVTELGSSCSTIQSCHLHLQKSGSFSRKGSFLSFFLFTEIHKEIKWWFGGLISVLFCCINTSHPQVFCAFRLRLGCNGGGLEKDDSNQSEQGSSRLFF